MSYLSKDGKWYKTSLEKMTADQAWEKQYNQQQEQNRLIAKQNRLLAEQKREQREREQQRIKLERENLEQQRYHEKELQRQQEQHDKEMALQKENHDKEMRLLQLFDSIGLHKSYYDKLESYLFPFCKEIVDIEYKKIDIESELKLMEIESENIYNDNLPRKLKEQYEKEVEKSLVTDKKEISPTNQEFIKNLKIYLPNDISSYDGTPKKLTHEIPDELIKELPTYKDIIELKENRKKCHKNAIISAIMLVIPFFGILLEIGSDSDFIAILYLIILFGDLGSIIFFLVKGNSHETKIRKILETEISKLEKSEVSTLEEKTKNKEIREKIYKKYLAKYEKMKEKLNHQLEEIEIEKIKTKKEIASPKWDNFTEFRKNHYNSNIEKALLDAGLREKIIEIGLSWPKINKNNMIKEGDIEDYIAYFDEL